MDVLGRSLGTGQVISKISRCGVCRSDIKCNHGENPQAKQTLDLEAGRFDELERWLNDLDRQLQVGQ